MGRTIAIPSFDPALVAGRRSDLSLYWTAPFSNQAAVGFGVAKVLEAQTGPEALELLTRLEEDEGPPDRGIAPPGPWFGGISFDLRRPPGTSWEGFGLSRWVVPEILIWKSSSGSFATAFVEMAERKLARIAAEIFSPATVGPETGPGRFEPDAELIVHRSDRASWDRLVGSALSAIEGGSLRKVVLARPLDVRSDRPIDPLRIVRRLSSYAPTCTTFLIRAGKEACFVGATPETLLVREGTELTTEALAGSAPPGEEEHLIAADKDGREHKEVVDGLLSGLLPLCDELVADPAPSLLCLPNVVHLRTPIRAKLHAGVSLARIVQAIHPSPAVGGSPKDKALGFLREHEGLDRGWYAGAIGWVGPRRSELKVALRSALLSAGSAQLFVGAGIVAGSTAQDEWNETEAKAVTMLRALGAGWPTPT